MNILHINTYDFGGAANAIKRIHLELLNQHIDSNMLVLYKYGNTPNTFAFTDRKINKLSRWLESKKVNRLQKRKDSFLNQVNDWYEVFSFPYSGYDITKHPLYDKADIIQLNWTGGFLDEPLFFKKNKKPVVWRMPDLYICNGGYHYQKAFPFDKFKGAIDENFSIREKIIKDNQNIFLIPISEWVMQKAKESPLTEDLPMQLIHNGINLDIFKPVPPETAKKKLKIPDNKKMILFGADSLVNKRKGFQFLLEVIQSSNIADECTICIFGNNTEMYSRQFRTINFINNDDNLADVYSAADLFIMPSIEEAFGQVTLESLACGTPVVSFPTGGSLDMIRNNFNGILAEDFTSQELKNAVIKGLNTIFDRNIIRKDIEKRFDIKDKTSQFIAVYDKLLSKETRHKNR